jgi:hypothetical protein
MQQETERINALALPEAERLAALAVLLSHETRLIQVKKLFFILFFFFFLF